MIEFTFYILKVKLLKLFFMKRRRDTALLFFV